MYQYPWYRFREAADRLDGQRRAHPWQYLRQSSRRAGGGGPAGPTTAAERRGKQAGFSERYTTLRESSEMSPQARGQEFENLWRDVLEFEGWHPRKIRISGEENDFTAIYQGLHILGEVRWFKNEQPMDGGKMREFLGKLGPRPQTIGFFVSHSGLDDGAKSVLRRAVNSKTVVVFDRTDIEAVLLDRSEIGAILEEKLRDAYDYLFEESREGG